MPNEVGKSESRERARAIVRDLCGGGDRRSIGNADILAKLMFRDPLLFDMVVEAIADCDPLVRMRASDAAEKTSRSAPHSLDRHKAALLGPVAQIDQAEVRWHLLRMWCRMQLSQPERQRAFGYALRWRDGTSRIVSAEALSCLASLALGKRALEERAFRAISESLKSDSAAVRARARKLLPKFPGRRDTPS